MKPKIFLLSFSLFCLGSAFAQSVKLYGYVQKSTPGIAAARDFDEAGNTKSTGSESAGGSYYMYITGPSKNRLYVIEGWLKGERIGLKAELVDAPVNVSDEKGESTTLVPETKEQVLQLTGTREVPGKNFTKAASLAKAAELVVVYKLNGRIGYATVKKLKAMKTAHLQ